MSLNLHQISLVALLLAYLVVPVSSIPSAFLNCIVDTEENLCKARPEQCNASGFDAVNYFDLTYKILADM